MLSSFFPATHQPPGFGRSATASQVKQQRYFLRKPNFSFLPHHHLRSCNHLPGFFFFIFLFFGFHR
ncbi:uncharacterized protein K452DRAFT_84734 [Aplosporella prunicola CBS 121167]|uniref:Uncharacterized protein n=1 Tax=Aplosporella prunicola CBS 121167 TaxID=1176127 RepID=A0A6A6B404_9PEZI|nr:uncharacterized protein K452DRAFT_84734 [Aplosporella prunicola CBS 121167]KAF2138800.1 hypothetical protein K452DRAFT_84734 [Aplosporella prunicola CBS 121167]